MTGTKPEALVWIIEDDDALGALLAEEVRDAGMEAHRASSAEEAIRMLAGARPDLVICDLKLPGMDGLSFLREMAARDSETPPGFILITAFGTIPKAVEALKAGADDFLTKPLDLEHLLLSVRRVLEKKRLRETVDRMRRFLSVESFHGMYGQSPPMRFLFKQIRQVAKAKGSVLILGESGSGKELVAKALHKESARKKGPFVPVNCAGIPEHLIESEFFGHAAGSFSGARDSRQGLFAEAEGGSILLDEISEMPLFLQAKLLRILQDGSLRRVGENREHLVDVRVIAATHRNLDENVRLGRFREDLFFRLETFALRIPPLREREGDIELLAARFLQHFSLALDKKVKGFSSEAIELVTAYPYPGNVRELRNTMERAVTFAGGPRIQPRDLPARIRNHRPADTGRVEPVPALLETSRLVSLAEMERQYIQHVLERTGGNKRQAAAILEIGRKTLYRKLEEAAPMDKG